MNFHKKIMQFPLIFLHKEHEMKKSLLAICILLFASQYSFATSNRIGALGGETAMNPNDDTNIDLFPQHINKVNLMRLTNIQSTTPSYAVITGEPGAKWGLYGGTIQQNDFFNIFRSLGANSAAKLGFAVSRFSEENKTNNKEASPANNSTTDKNSYYSLSVDGIYGKDMGDTEVSIRGIFSYGPNAIATVGAIGSTNAGPFGTFEYTDITDTTTTDSDGEGNQTLISAVASARKPMKIAVFSKVFANAFATLAKSSSSLATGTTKLEDESSSTIALGGRILLFEEKKIGEKSRVIYGVGAQGAITRVKTEDKAPSTDAKATTLTVTGPQIRLGAESDLKYGTVRFGIARDFTLLNYTSGSTTTVGGTENDTTNTKSLSFANSGVYAVSTGFGIEYKSLAIDVSLSRFFWVHGPQMFFDSQNGTIATSADVIYTF